MSAMRKVLPILLLLGLAAGLWHWWPSDRRRLGARFDEVLGRFEKRGDESQLEAFASVRGVVSTFAPGFVVMARPYGGTITDAQSLAAIIHSYRDSATRVQVSDSGREIEVQSARGTATMTSTVTVDGTRGGTPGRERLRVRISWRKDDGVWRIQELEILEVLDTTGIFF